MHSVHSKSNHCKISQTLLCPGKLNLLLSNKENKIKAFICNNTPVITINFIQCTIM